MKPVDFSSMPVFTFIRRQMRIPRDYPVSFKLASSAIAFEWSDPLKQGLDIRADDENFTFGDEGLFYKGRRVLLYIRDQNAQYYNKGYKYHITWCRTLQTMHDNHRYDKYVVSTNTNGIFRINLVVNNVVEKQVEEELHVCKNCLSALNWHGYRDAFFKTKEVLYNHFSLDEFFKAYQDDNQGNFALLPDETDMTAPPNVYPADWQVISKCLKKIHHFTCSECGRRIDDPTKLHVHHVNGIKNDVRDSNLRVLCADCHQRLHPDHKIFGSDLWDR
ncbi:HNH endonuclease [Mitsuokella jalaludinii]|uniref:HNH endonuclease n=1 Tax=Mitsuokella jalaludinii TaxID=187979 RepID=UPI003F9B2ED7